jgi:tetratricopeptide (TPR) repeat protein
VIFEEVLKMSNIYTPAMTGIGQSLEMMGNHREAINWYRKAFALNPIDYIACWSLGRALHEVGSYDSAVTYLLHAWILNRNSPDILRDLERMASEQNSSVKKWVWVPQYRITETDGKVLVAYQQAWMGYALCQAVWMTEPGFSQSREISGDFSMYRERECLSCLVNTMGSDEKGAPMDPALMAFKTALEKRLALEFILFEILLPANPDMAFLLDDQRMQRLIAYLKITRMDSK